MLLSKGDMVKKIFLSVILMVYLLIHKEDFPIYVIYAKKHDKREHHQASSRLCFSYLYW